MSNTDEPNYEWPEDYPPPPPDWNPQPAEGGGLDVTATATATLDGEDFTYPVQWVGDDPETDNGWVWWDGERMHGVAGPPTETADGWTWEADGVTVTVRAAAA